MIQLFVGEIGDDDDSGVEPVNSIVIFADSFEIGSKPLWSPTAPTP